MLGLFKKKSKTQVLQKKYEKLLKEAYELSTVNRSESDKKYVEAEEVMKEIETLENK